MMTKSCFWKAACATGALLAMLMVDVSPDGSLPLVSFTPDAQARVGRPLTPVSVAGVARRTTRRVVRRSAIYISTLPAGCGQVNINGAMYWQCGATYYQQSGTQYVVVYVE